MRRCGGIRRGRACLKDKRVQPATIAGERVKHYSSWGLAPAMVLGTRSSLACEWDDVLFNSVVDIIDITKNSNRIVNWSKRYWIRKETVRRITREFECVSEENRRRGMLLRISGPRGKSSCSLS